MRYTTFFAFALILFVTISACKDGTDSLKDPILIVNAIPTSGKAAERITFDVNVNATSDIKNLTMTEKYANLPERVLIDSTFAAGRKSFVRNFFYTIPDMASTGQQSVITFTITDASNKTATKTININITGGRPNITITPQPESVDVNQQLNFDVRMRNTANNMVRLNVEESVAASSNQNVFTATLNNARDTTLIMPYIVGNHPEGDLILLTFTVTESDSTKTSKVIKFTVK